MEITREEVAAIIADIIDRTRAPEAPIAVTVQRAAELCGVSQGVIRHAIQVGDIAPRYPTSRPVILVDELRAWLNARHTPPR